MKSLKFIIISVILVFCSTSCTDNHYETIEKELEKSSFLFYEDSFNPDQSINIDFYFKSIEKLTGKAFYLKEGEVEEWHIATTGRDFLVIRKNPENINAYVYTQNTFGNDDKFPTGLPEIELELSDAGKIVKFDFIQNQIYKTYIIVHIK